MERGDLSLGVFGQWDEKQERCPGRRLNERGSGGACGGQGVCRRTPIRPPRAPRGGGAALPDGARCGPRVGRGEGAERLAGEEAPLGRDRLRRAPAGGESRSCNPGGGKPAHRPAWVGGAHGGAPPRSLPPLALGHSHPRKFPPYPPKPSQTASRGRKPPAAGGGARAGGPGRGEAGRRRPGAAPCPRAPAGAHTYPRARGSRLRRPSRRAPLAARCAPGPAGARREPGAAAAAAAARAPARPAGGRLPRLRRQGENRAEPGRRRRRRRAGPPSPGRSVPGPGPWLDARPGAAGLAGAPRCLQAGAAAPPPPPPAALPSLPSLAPARPVRSLRASLSPLNAHRMEKKTTCSQVAINFRGGRSSAAAPEAARSPWSPTPARPRRPLAPQPE